MFRAKMHFSIPDTEVRSGENGSTYVVSTTLCLSFFVVVVPALTTDCVNACFSCPHVELMSVRHGLLSLLCTNYWEGGTAGL